MSDFQNRDLEGKILGVMIYKLKCMLHKLEKINGGGTTRQNHLNICEELTPLFPKDNLAIHQKSINIVCQKNIQN